MIILGVDTGGTFTDFVLQTIPDSGEDIDSTITVHKVLSTPQAPERAILQGIKELGLNQTDQAVFIVHGSTVATNAVLEGKGVSTAFITNRGFGDMLTIGRQARQQLYNLQPEKFKPPVDKLYCLETGGRLAATGDCVEPLTRQDLQQLKQQLKQLAPKAVAINMLFSFLDESIEKKIADIVPKNMFVSRSSYVLPEFKEYERGITTWLNASVGPIVKGYLDRLDAGLSNYNKQQVQVSVMQSSGGTIKAEHAAKQAVHMLLSGPAGGMSGARYTAACSSVSRLLTFDMGGTSTDVALIDGDLQLTTDGKIGHYPVAIPMVDMHTIGAGGGSIASIDSGGLLQVGPKSAGADPGPACYGKASPTMADTTVTDANLILGRLLSAAFLGGHMSLNIKAAIKAITPLAKTLALSVEETALGIIQVANQHMARALRVMSVGRGIDPKQLSLVSFGGAGGLHVCALAEALGMSNAMVPIHAGVLSALGMLVAPRARHLSKSYNTLIFGMNLTKVLDEYQSLSMEGLHALLDEGVKEKDISTKKRVDCRYQGQSYTLTLDWQKPEDLYQAFHACHEQRYGHQLDLPVEIVTLRVSVSTKPRTVTLSQSVAHVNQIDNSTSMSYTELYGIEGRSPVYQRSALKVGDEIIGPALITETVSTTLVEQGWRCVCDFSGNLLLQR